MSTWLYLCGGSVLLLTTVATVVCVAASMLSSRISQRLGE